MHMQVFEQLFQLYEQQVPKRAERDMDREMWINPAKYEYRCPGEQLVDVSFKCTPDQPSLRLFYLHLYGYAYAAFAFGFLFVSLALGIFKYALSIYICQPLNTMQAQPCMCTRYIEELPSIFLALGPLKQSPSPLPVPCVLGHLDMGLMHVQLSPW